MTQISTDALELLTRHRDRRRVLRLGNPQMVLIDVHELEVVFGHAIRFGGFEDDVEDIGGVFGFEGQNVFVLRAAEDLVDR